tara:strand:+ start:1486 stop:2469 length:984 start_codon:yes stop_codon:yes gene_type:complete
MKIGIQLTKNPDKYKYLLSLLKKELTSLDGMEFIHISDDEDLKQKIQSLDILTCYHLPENVYKLTGDKLKWVHFGNAGIEKSMHPSLLNSRTIITNARGIHAGPVSEFVMGMVLYIAKQFKGCEQFKTDKIWTQWKLARKTMQLNVKTIGIIGFGAIGKAIAKKAKAFDMKVMAVRRLQKQIEHKKSIDELLPISKMNYLLKTSDFVVIACPLTPDTKNMIGGKELSKMKKSAFIINIARGEIIEENALIEALRQKEIAGAALDVFKSEPLPENNPFFGLDNVFLSPHISGNFPEYQQDVVLQFADNLNRFKFGKPIKNRVCKKRQY